MTPTPALGRIGIWTAALGYAPVSQVRDIASEAEQLGYAALWLSEGLTRDPFLDATLALESTSNLVLATGIASIWARHPRTAAGFADGLAQAYPGRFLLGLGTSNKFSVERLYGLRHAKPYTAMRDYLDAIDAARGTLASVLPGFAPADASPKAPRVLAALGPKMLRLAAERGDGAHPYLTSPRHTRMARSVLGPGKLLAVEQAVVLHSDRETARAVAHAHVNGYLPSEAYRANWLRLGFTEEDFAGGASRGLVDALVAYGDAHAIARRVREHLDAGADHVCVQALEADSRTLPLGQWRALARALI